MTRLEEQFAASSPAAKPRRRRSKVDGKLRFPCPNRCGRLEATDDDWADESIGEGERDDLCWGYAANCTNDWPPR